MSKDTKAIIATIVTTAIGLGALLVNRIGNVEDEVRGVRAQLNGRIERLDDELSSRIERLDDDLSGRIERLRSEMLENYHRLDERMRSVEQGFARIDQRLDTLERAVIPAAEPAQ